MKRKKIKAVKAAPVASGFADVELPGLPDLPGMISEAEGRFLYWLASTQLEGVGAVVEVGSWLGRSTVHLAAGLRRAGHAAKLHCFDKFTWSRRDSTRAELNLSPGDDVQPHFEKNVSEFKDQVIPHRTMFADLSWEQESIELLFLDGPKNRPDIARAFEVFGPHLIPRKSFIVLQDYLYCPAYALAATVQALGDRLELTHVVLGGLTVAFRVRKRIDFATGRSSSWDVHRWSRAEAQSHWASILTPLPPSARGLLEPGRALHLYDLGERAAAVEAMRSLPMPDFQRDMIRNMSQSRLYLNYPELFECVGFPGSTYQKARSRVRRFKKFVKDSVRDS